MSDFGVFEAAASDEGEVARSTREAQARLEAAVYDVRENFPFLMAATGLDDFGDRWHLALKDIRRTVESAGVFPASGPMGKIQRHLRREVKARLEKEGDWREMLQPVLRGLGEGLSGGEGGGGIGSFINGLGEGIRSEVPPTNEPAPDTSGISLQDVLGPFTQGLGEGLRGANRREEEKRKKEEYRRKVERERKERGFSLNDPGTDYGDSISLQDPRYSRRTAARPLHEIARDIKNTWPKVNYAAQPYLDALSELNDISDMYYQDPAKYIVNYFLSNATTWRGEDAKRIKQELKDMVSGRSAAVSELGYDWPPKEDEDEYRPDPRDWSDKDKKKTRDKDKKKSAGVDDAPPLIPEGDFKGYLDDVAPQAEPSAERNMSPTPFPGAQEHDRDPAEHNFTARKAALSRFAAWCQRTGRNVNDPNALELYSFACAQADYPIVATALRRLAEEEAKEDEGDKGESESSETKSAPKPEGGESEAPAEEGEGGGDQEAQIQQLVEAFLQFCQQMGLQPSPEAVQAFAQQAGLPPEAVQILTQVLQQMGGGQPQPEQAPAGPPQGAPQPPMPQARRHAGVDLKNVTIADESQNLFKGEDSSGNTVVFRASDEDAKQLREVMFGDLAVNFSGVTVDEADIVKQGSLGKADAPKRGRTAQGEMPMGAPAPGAPAPLENQAVENNLLDTALQAVQQMQERERAEFEQINQALDQATQALQLAIQVEQAEQPMNVTPPEGTVQVRPDSPEQIMQQQGMPPQGDPAAAQGMMPPGPEQMIMPQARVAAPSKIKLPQPGKVIERSQEVGPKKKDQDDDPFDTDFKHGGFKNDVMPVLNGGGPRDPWVDDYLRWTSETGTDPNDENSYNTWGKQQRAPKQQPLARNSRLAHGGKYESAVKEAWTGWGPAQPGSMKVAGWSWDGHLNGYTASAPYKFACSCGSEFDVPSYYNCRCGKIWNSYPIGTAGGDGHREASVDKWLCREIVGGVGVVMANNRTAAEDEDPITDYDGERGEKEERRIPSTTVNQPPKDWARRDKDGTWTGPAVGPKRR